MEPTGRRSRLSTPGHPKRWKRRSAQAQRITFTCKLRLFAARWSSRPEHRCRKELSAASAATADFKRPRLTEPSSRRTNVPEGGSGRRPPTMSARPKRLSFPSLGGKRRAGGWARRAPGEDVAAPEAFFFPLTAPKVLEPATRSKDIWSDV